MKKIAIDARESGTSTGRYVDKLVEHLHKLQPAHEMVILVKSHRLDFMHSIAPSFTVLESPYQEFSFAEQLGLRKQVASLNADLVHFAIVQQPVFYKGKVVTTMHDLTTLRFRNPAKNPLVFTLKQQVYKWVNQRVARKSVAIITPTEFVKQDIVNYTGVSPDKISVTLESADKITEPAEPFAAAEGKQFLLYVGRSQPHKNLQRLIDAFALAKQQNPRLHLVLAGKCDAASVILQDHVKRQGIAGVIFTDWVSEGQLRWLYEHAILYVFPSLSEGFGLPPLEAMYYDLPVASSNATCLPEVSGDAAIYFDPLNTSAIAETISTVINDAALRQQLIKKGRQQIKLYSWQRMAEQTLAIYEKVLNES